MDDKELMLIDRRLGEVENEIIKLKNRLESYDIALQNHSQRIDSLKAGIDTALAQAEENRVKLQNLKPIINPFRFW